MKRGPLSEVGISHDSVLLDKQAVCDFACEHFGAGKPGSGNGGLRGLRQALEACVMQVTESRLGCEYGSTT